MDWIFYHYETDVFRQNKTQLSDVTETNDKTEHKGVWQRKNRQTQKRARIEISISER